MSSDSSTPSENGSTAGLKLVDPAIDTGDVLTAGTSPTPTPTSTPTPANREGESDARRVPLWMLVVALLLGVVVIGWQAQLANELEAEVAGLERQLDRSQAVVEAQMSHLGEIRSGVYALSDQLDGLRALIDEGPHGRAVDLGESPPSVLSAPTSTSMP